MVFFVAAWQLGPLCLALAPIALVFLVGYSYTKRFTWLSHWILGFTDGAAAAGAWIAVRGTMEAPAWLLWLAVTVWIAGFDLLYACQDVAFDRREGLHSVPARFGIAAALRAARVSHVLTALALAAAGWASGSASSTGSAGAWWSGSSSTSTRSCPRPTSRGSTWPSST